MKNIKTGNFKQCLADFFKRFGRTEELWKFAKVSSGTEAHWRLHGVIPLGEVHMRVLFFLELIGYELDELRDVPKEVAIVGRCVAFGIIKIGDVSKELNIRPTYFLKYVRNDTRPAPGRISKMDRLISENSEKLSEVIRAKRQELQALMIEDHCARPVQADVARSAQDDELIKEFAAACARVREIGEKFLKGPEEIRRALRRHMSKLQSPEIHLTWDVLHQLMKERKNEPTQES